MFRIAGVLMLLPVLVVTATAHDLGSAMPPKPSTATVAPPPDPAMIRQGGDTIADAMRIPALPQWGVHGLDGGLHRRLRRGVPVFRQHGSPDVVYSLVPAADDGDL
jgi:hypothetical protein